VYLYVCPECGFKVDTNSLKDTFFVVEENLPVLENEEDVAGELVMISKELKEL